MFGGLFPEINRAYMTVDNRIYLWDYHNENSYEVFEDSHVKEIIICAAVVRCKPGVFTEKVKFVLVLATTVEVLLLGIIFDKENVHSRLRLYKTKFSLPTDGIKMLKITGQANAINALFEHER